MGKVFVETANFPALVYAMNLAVKSGDVPGWAVKEIDDRPCFTYVEGNECGWFWPDTALPTDSKNKGAFSLLHGSGNNKMLTHEMSLIFRNEFVRMLQEHFDGYFQGSPTSTIQ